MPGKRASSDPATAAKSAQEARRINDLIDEGLKRDMEALKSKKSWRQEVKVMLLGQAESGKSTLRKQFQLYYKSKEMDAERPAWRPVVYSNLIRAVRVLVQALDTELSDLDDSMSAHPLSAAPSIDSESPPNSPGASWPPALRAVRRQLLPLLAIEDSLASEISGGVCVAGRSADGRARGAYVRADWQALFGATNPLSWLSGGCPVTHSSGLTTNITNLAARHLASAAAALEEIWLHPIVCALHEKGDLDLEEGAPFFLDNIVRITQPDYSPTNEDILTARLKSLGIADHTFEINYAGSGYSWTLYDVGGARGQRPSWIPFFDDATAIIFLAPISAFDQYLEEDPKVNRIDDSLQLWTLICTNKLLRDAALILLLNKVDLLKSKLEAGARVRKYVTSYGDRPNTFEDVAEYFRGHFIQVQKRKDTTKRPLYVQFSSTINIKDSQRIIVSVNDSIMATHLARSGLT